MSSQIDDKLVRRAIDERIGPINARNVVRVRKRYRVHAKDMENLTRNVGFLLLKELPVGYRNYAIVVQEQCEASKLMLAPALQSLVEHKEYRLFRLGISKSDPIFDPTIACDLSNYDSPKSLAIKIVRKLTNLIAELCRLDENIKEIERRAETLINLCFVVSNDSEYDINAIEPVDY